MDNQRREIYKRILSILEKYTDSHIFNSLTIYSTINGDIGLHGDDARFFLKEVKAQYDLNDTEFDFEKYFHSEGGPVIFFKLLKINHQKNPFTINSLIECVVSGVLH